MLNEYSTTLQQAVYQVVYCSRQQRFRRAIALSLLISKYIFRSLYIIWPLYIVICISIFMPLERQYLYYALALLPGLLFWCVLYFIGIHREYAKYVQGQLLNKDDLRQIFKRK